jgi:hypothetical protein
MVNRLVCFVMDWLSDEPLMTQFSETLPLDIPRFSANVFAESPTDLETFLVWNILGDDFAAAFGDTDATYSAHATELVSTDYSASASFSLPAIAVHCAQRYF